jgi:hypothetical protein
LSVCFYPILFYFSRWAFPNLHLGLRKIELILVVLCVIIVYGQRKYWKEQFQFENLERVGLFFFAVTISSRLLTAHLQPYPAWSDSLHHTMLTQLVATTGQLPYTLEPYEPSVLQMYHLGLYAITGVVQQLSRTSAMTALLWTAQFLNGLSGLGIYLVLDRFSGRKGALIATAVVGFFSFQLAWYVNWGRFTQVSSQSVMLIAFALTYEAIEYWGRFSRRVENLWMPLIASFLMAGTFLIHFRVAGLLIPLLAIGVIWLLYRSVGSKRLAKELIAIVIVGIIALVLISPALWPSLRAYIQGVSLSISEQTQTDRLAANAYYDYPMSAYITLGAQWWIYALALLALVVGLIYKSKLSLAMLLWLACLWGIGNAYRLGLHWLSFINYTGIMIMFYLPLSVLIGEGAEILMSHFSIFQQPVVLKTGLEALILFSVIFGFIRSGSIDDFRYFLSPADIEAMSWIEANTPKDAVFAINTYMWLGNAPHGTDGGYWIPFFTGRRTTTGTMIANQGPENFNNQIINWSRAEEDVAVNSNDHSVYELCQQGVNYIYIGVKGDFSAPGLDEKAIQKIPSVKILYQNGGVFIFRLCGQ